MDMAYNGTALNDELKDRRHCANQSTGWGSTWYYYGELTIMREGTLNKTIAECRYVDDHFPAPLPEIADQLCSD